MTPLLGSIGVGLALLSSLSAAGLAAQSQEEHRPARAQIGFAAGLYQETAEGNKYSASFSPSVVMDIGTRRWSFELELGRSGRICFQTSCHSHTILNLGAVRRFGFAESVRPYISFGCCLVRLAGGLDVPMGDRLLVALGYDFVLLDSEALASRPKVAISARF